ncbi:MAG: prepilin-type N-terminal cleavage/methylation domain-containing protein [Sulfurimonas sp.]
MVHLQRVHSHRGFTLLELLIVILLVSLIIYMGFSAVKMEKPKPKALTPLNLKESIMQSREAQEKVTFLCVDKCRTCFIRKGYLSEFEPYSHPIDLTEIKAYTLDRYDNLHQIEYGRFDDQSICLLMEFFPNGSSTQIILEDDSASYLLPSFFDKAKKFDTIEDAKAYWLRNSQAVSNSGDYY